MKKNYPLGWLPDVPDVRDVPFRAVFRMPRRLPAAVDLAAGCSAVEDQGALGSCTAQALVGALEFLQLRAMETGLKCKYADLSRLFVYYNTREAMGTVHEDSGAMLRTAIKQLVRRGCCREDGWPYIIEKFTEKPPQSCYRKALNHKVTAYQRLAALEDMKACLALGLPFVFGFAVYEHVMSAAVERTGLVRLPRKGERMLGGHAVMAAGYDDRRKLLKFRNSWGEKWGKNGYGFLPYAYLESRELSDDFWCVQSVLSHCYLAAALGSRHKNRYAAGCYT